MGRTMRWLVAICVTGSLIGCGGGSTTPTVSTPRPLPGTAKFHVDVTTGQATVTPNAVAGSRAIMLGGTVSFTTSNLLDQPGNTGLKILSVALTNRWVQDIGRQPDGAATGLRVLFSPFVATQPFSDLRPRVTVSALMVSPVNVFASVDGPLSSASFVTPFGAAVGDDGSIYVADAGGNRLRKIRAGFVSTLAGSGTAGPTDGLGAAAQLAAPGGVAVDPRDGSLIVTELSGHRVRRVTTAGRVTTVAGGVTTGSANGPGNLATFTNPVGVAVGADGTIYVMERNGQRLRRIVQTGADPGLAASYTVSTLAGSGAPGLRDGVGAEAQFSFASGLALAPDGRLYVADTGNHRIRLVTPDGAVVTIAGSGAASSIDGDGATASFNQPFGVVWSGQALVVTENTGQVIRQVSLRAGGTAAPANPQSWAVQTIAGTPGSTTFVPNGDGTVATFAGLRLPAVTSAGTLVATEAENRAIRLVTPPNGLFPVGTPSGGSGDAGQVRLSSADGLIPSSIFGSNLPYVAYPGALAPGASTAAKPWVFAVPAGVTAFEFMVTVEADTAVAVPPEAASNAVTGARLVGSPNVRVRTVAGSEPGLIDGDAAQARFSILVGLARDALGNLYLADRAGRIRCLDAGGRVYTIAGADPAVAGSLTGLDGPGDVIVIRQLTSIAVTPDGQTVYLTDAGINRVRMARLTGSDRTNPASWTVNTIAGAGTIGPITIATSTGDQATFAGVSALVLASPDDLYLTETIGNRVRRMHFLGGDRADPTNWQVTTVAGDTAAIVGASGVVDGVGTQARFAQPAGLAVDRAGGLYVSEQAGCCLRYIAQPAAPPGSARVGLFAGPTTTITAGRNGLADGAANTARFDQPIGLAFDSAGYLYVADYNNRRIRRVAPNGAVSTVAGSGGLGAIADGTSNTILFLNLDGTGADCSFNAARAVALDPSGNLYVGDGSRLRLIERTLTTPIP